MKVLFAAAMAVALPVLSACSPDMFGAEQPRPPGLPGTCPPSPSAPLAVAVGARANVPRPELPQGVQGIMRDVAGNHQPLTLIRLDGKPGIVFNEQPPERKANETADRRAADDYVSKASEAFNQRIQAQNPEADVLSALSLGATAVPAGGTVVLADSGLQTVPPLDFAGGKLFDASPEEIVDYLAEHRLLPDLKERKVVLVGFGNTAAPQPELNNSLRAKVVDVWKAVAERSGACVTVLPQANTEKSVDGSPGVAVVETPPLPDPQFCGTVALGEQDNIAFTPNTANFRDPQAARDTMRKFADAIRGGKRRADLMGTTASDGPVDGRVDLSNRRAEAVEAVLIEQGVPADRITSRGVGTDWPGHQPDTGPDGKLLPGPAGQNRKVVMTVTCAD